MLIAIALCGGGYLVWQQGMIGRAASEAGARDVPENPPASDSNGGEEQLPDNPIDFNEVRSKNNDVYAWLYVPGTEVNVPILQSPADDTYYLTHDAEKQEDPVGAVFTQLKNKTDFSDPVTVVYGHDVDGLFKTLHDYEDADHFNANKTFYIYRPGHILTYTLVSAYKYDDRHILNSFDFSQPDVLSRYFDFVQNPDSLLKNVNPDVTLDANSKIVQLSTCMLNEFHGNSRFIVTGVLVNDQETK